jgi:hypothetical protein
MLALWLVLGICCCVAGHATQPPFGSSGTSLTSRGGGSLPGVLPWWAVMVGVGRAGAQGLGGCWRWPPLALAEFATASADAVQLHSLPHVRALIRSQPCTGSVGGAEAGQRRGIDTHATAAPRKAGVGAEGAVSGQEIMRAAARAQALAAASVDVAVLHNQVRQGEAGGWAQEGVSKV